MLLEHFEQNAEDVDVKYEDKIEDGERFEQNLDDVMDNNEEREGSDRILINIESKNTLKRGN